MTTTLRSTPFVRAFTAAGIVLAALLLLTTVSPAQDGAPRVFGEVIDVRVVNVEAVVTDKDGNRVYGLGPEDFRLFVDGREVGVEFFTEIQGGRAVAEEAQAPSAPSTLPRVEAGEAVGMSYLVFIDDFYSIKNERNRILARLLEQVPLVRPEDRMAVVAFNGNQLDMLTSWTSNQAVLERVFEDARQRPTKGIYVRSQKFSGFGFSENGTGAASRIENLERRQQFERVTTAAISALRSFAMPPGRKVMLMITGQWPAAAFFDRFGQSASGATATDLKLASPIAETANLLGYTLYPIDTAGIKVNNTDVELAGPQLFLPTDDPATPFEIALGPTSTAGGLSSEMFRAATLSHIAAQTGGRALLDKERFEALPTIAEDTGAFYWLGFTADRRLDDAHHRIRLEVVRPGLEVRSRRGYRDLSRPTELAMMAQSALLFGNPLEATSLRVELGTPEKLRWQKMEVPLRVAIPADQLTLLPSADGYVAQVELRVAAKDPDGDLSQMPTVPLQLVRAQAPEAGARLFYETNLKLRRLKHQLVVSVHDVASGNTITSIATVEP